MTQLDRKAVSVFAGKVVRKDLVRTVKEGVTIPVYVLEYLLGKYCATDDPLAIKAGMRVVNTTISESCVSSDKSNIIQSRLKERGKYTLIDKVKVRYVSSEDRYWAEIVNFSHKFVHVPERFIRQYERLLAGGIWAQVQLLHHPLDESGGGKSPFWIDDIQPIQLASFDIEDYKEGRRHFTGDEWLDFMIRSIGLEPSCYTRRVKLLFLCRLIPLCEPNYNLVELGPRETGKSHAFQQLSPYAILLTGPTTVPNMFYHMGTGKVGLVGLWDAVAFDEVSDLQKMKKDVVTTLKTYCESGTFARGKESSTGIASIALFGNMDQPVENLLNEAHLFQPMPEVIRDDMAFLDRIHYYLPGWEVPKMKTEFFTSHYGMVVDYLAEALHEMRNCNFTEALDRDFKLSADLKSRDVKAIRKTVSGLIKMLYPHGEYSKDELRELVELAMEGRRRVKEQLRRIGAFEFRHLAFKYRDTESGEEREVLVPEEAHIPRQNGESGEVREAMAQREGHISRQDDKKYRPASHETLYALIARGESSTSEFKETFEADAETGQKQAGILASSLKTIAAFLNTDGGTLLIGVADSGTIKGLDKDLKLCKGNNHDGFEQKIRCMIADHFKPQPHGKISIKFEELAEGTICIIEIKSLIRPELVHFDKDIYIRDGNGTRKLEGPDLTHWITQRTKE